MARKESIFVNFLSLCVFGLPIILPIMVGIQMVLAYTNIGIQEIAVNGTSNLNISINTLFEKGRLFETVFYLLIAPFLFSTIWVSFLGKNERRISLFGKETEMPGSIFYIFCAAAAILFTFIIHIVVSLVSMKPTAQNLFVMTVFLAILAIISTKRNE